MYKYIHVLVNVVSGIFSERVAHTSISNLLTSLVSTMSLRMWAYICVFAFLHAGVREYGATWNKDKPIVLTYQFIIHRLEPGAL